MTEMYTYKYPRPSVTVDILVFGVDSEKQDLQILLIQRKGEPFKGQWALPGGFVDMEESADEAAMRELEEETGVTNVEVEQLYTFSDPERDPRGRVLSVAYYTLGPIHKVKAGDDAGDAKWFSLEELPELAFDHSHILEMGIKKIGTNT